MGDDPPLQQNLPVHGNKEIVIQELSPQQSSSAPKTPGQSANMEFDSHTRQTFGMTQFAEPNHMDMTAIANALPDYSMRQFQQQSYHQQYPTHPHGAPAMMYQFQPGGQFAGQAASNYTQPFTQQFPTQFMQNHQPRHQPNTYAPFVGNNPGPGGHPQQYQNPYFFQQPIMHGPNSGVPNQHTAQTQLPLGGAHYPGGYNPRPGAGYHVPQLRLDSSMTQSNNPAFYQQPPPPVRRSSSNSSLQTTSLRGPPRKPKQSGHALWVGNLPPGTHIIDLKDHFSREATDDIESVFLISKSNCAFVNYKTESSCAAAMSRFHDSRFQGVRLVCRLRRGSNSPGAQPTTPQPQAVSSNEPLVPDTASGDTSAVEDSPTKEDAEPSVEKVKEKFFVVKSLTIEDLDRSVQSGIWATQAHNEAALNNAYKSAENVFLIFSANKSGEYFGYARMESAINDDATATIEVLPRPEVPAPSPANLPLTILTPATATAPKGRVIDDSARGTIFWEADNDDHEKEEQNTDEETGNVSGEGDESASPAAPPNFGKPFKIKWMSTERLPFYRTRGLRNPWNSNREVKIARDGTEIEPGIGRRLVSMFHRPHAPAGSPTSLRQQPPMQGGIGGFLPPNMPPPGGMYPRSY